MGVWLESGGRFEGTYLGHTVAGVVKRWANGDVAGTRQYAVVFDEPVDVVKSKAFSSFRQNVTVTLQEDGNSVDHKGNPNGIAAFKPAA